MGRLAADFAEHAGINHLIAVDLHSPQVEGFFHVPVENLTAEPVISDALKRHGTRIADCLSRYGRNETGLGVRFPLGCPVAVLHKERLNGTESVVNRVVGDVRGKACVIIDDMISTGGTIKNAIDALVQAGAREQFIVAATHPVFTSEARKNLHHPSIQQIIVTDSIPITHHHWRRVYVVSLAPLLTSAIRRDVSAAR